MAQASLDYGPRHEWVRELGSGAFGAQLMCDNTTGELMAIKYIPLRDVDDDVERELLSHRKLLNHPNIVQLKEAFVTTTHLAIAMEYVRWDRGPSWRRTPNQQRGGDLFHYVMHRGQLAEDAARFYFQQLVCSVAWCRSKGVSPRDIKLENTLLEGAGSPARAKIGTFDFSKESARHMNNQLRICGTPAYLAPEVLDGGEYNGTPADVWSCGVALYVMLVGSLPFLDPTHPNSYPKMVERIRHVQYYLPSQQRLSPGCVDLIQRIFVHDPQKRISLQAVQQHSWFLNNLLPDFQNDALHLHLRPPAQSEPELVAVVQQAKQQGHAMQQQMDRDILGAIDESLLDEPLLDLME